MDPSEREQLEHEVRSLCDRGDYEAATTRTLRSYGPEIFGFLVALHRSEQDAADVFSDFGESLWKGLPGFAWRSSLRTWAYTLARHASHHFRHKARRERANVPLSAASAVSELVQKVRTETLTYLRTERRTRMQALRESLPTADQMLLVLRVDKAMAWEDLARVMGEGGELEPEELKRESARLRKRFQLVKEKLLTLAKREGLLPPDE